MANKKINELDLKTLVTLTDLMIVGDPGTGTSYKTTLQTLQNLIASASGVTSFNGRTGAVVPTSSDYSISLLSDVLLTSLSNGQILQYDSVAAKWKNVAVPASGITALNSLSASSQSLVVGTSGTDFNISSATSTHTFNLPTASASNRGALSSADWTTFNNKQNAITLTTTGNSGAATFVSNTLNIPNYTLAGLGGISLTSLSATSPLLYNNTTGAFSIQVANSTQNGYLSSTDWNTFNSKGSGTVTSVAIATGTTGTDINVSGSPITGSGTITINIPTAGTGTRGVVSTAAQTFAGDKTFSGRIIGQQDVTGNSFNLSSLTGTMATPNFGVFYAKNDNLPYFKNSAGTEYPLYNAPTGGTVTTVSVVSANGFAGTVATATTTPAITLTTTITGLLKGNGTAISSAVANTDYQSPITLTTTGTSGVATFNGTTLNIPNYGATAGMSNPMTTLGDIIVGDTGGTPIRLAGNTLSAKRFLTQTGTGAASALPSWGTIAASDIASGQALTETDDTNVTLTLGGTPSTALLQAVSLTLGWTGQLAISRGGTGLSALGTQGQLLRVNTGATALEYFTPTYISSAITSIGTAGNLQTGAAQTLATGTTGTDFNIASATNTHTFNIPDASASARGLVTTGTQTFGGSKTFQSSTQFSNNLFSATNTNGSSSAGNYLLTGSSATSYRNAFTQNSVGGTMPNSATSSFAENLFCGVARTAPATGSYLLTTTVAIKGFAITTGTGVITNASSLYISEGTTGATNNYAIWVDDGVVRFDGAFELQNIANTTTANVLYYDATTKRVTYGATPSGGSGITSLNSLTAATQTFANDTNVTITSATSTHTIGWAGQLSVARGGTGLSALGTANQLLRVNAGATALEYFTIAGSDVTGAALTKTDDTNVTLTLGGTPATSLLRAASLTLGWTGTLAVGRGGSGASTLTGVLIGNGTSAFTGVAGTASQLLRRNAGNTAYEFFTIAGSDITGAALTKTDDTNVTLTLGGTPATSLLRAASLTLGWSGTLAVSRGGIGVGTLTGFAIGNGTSAFTSVPLANVAYFGTAITGTPSASTYLRGDGSWGSVSISEPNLGVYFVDKRYSGAGAAIVTGLTYASITSTNTQYNTQKNNAKRGSTISPFPDPWSARNAAYDDLQAGTITKAVIIVLQGKWTVGSDNPAQNGNEAGSSANSNVTADIGFSSTNNSSVASILQNNINAYFYNGTELVYINSTFGIYMIYVQDTADTSVWESSLKGDLTLRYIYGYKQPILTLTHINYPIYANHFGAKLYVRILKAILPSFALSLINGVQEFNLDADYVEGYDLMLMAFKTTRLSGGNKKVKININVNNVVSNLNTVNPDYWTFCAFTYTAQAHASNSNQIDAVVNIKTIDAFLSNSEFDPAIGVGGWQFNGKYIFNIGNIKWRCGANTTVVGGVIFNSMAAYNTSVLYNIGNVETEVPFVKYLSIENLNSANTAFVSTDVNNRIEINANDVIKLQNATINALAEGTNSPAAKYALAISTTNPNSVGVAGKGIAIINCNVQSAEEPIKIKGYGNQMTLILKGNYYTYGTTKNVLIIDRDNNPVNNYLMLDNCNLVNQDATASIDVGSTNPTDTHVIYVKNVHATRAGTTTRTSYIGESITVNSALRNYIR
jgi:hypothetical protein